MSYTGISNCLPQYSSGSIPALDRYIKFYAAGTTTPILGATNASGGTLVDKFRINNDGYPVNATNDHTIPHIDQVYKIALFLTEADADANNLNNAVWVIDNMEPVRTTDSFLDQFTETITLTDGQTQFTSSLSPDDVSVYVNGILADNGRLVKNVDYVYDVASTTYTLSQSYPAGSTITLVANEPVGDTPTDTDITVFANVAALEAQTGLTVGDRVQTKGYYTDNDGGQADYLIVAGGTGTDDGGSYLDLANGNQAELRVDGTFNIAHFGVIDDASNQETRLDNAVSFLNSSDNHTLYGIEGKTYKYNGIGLKLESNKTFDARHSTFNTDSASFLVLTEGTYDNHRENIAIRNVITTGFSEPIQILFADNSLIERCVCTSPINNGIQVKGDDLIGNVVKECEVDSPTFHCYATNDSVNFDPSHTDQGLRYPKDTVFRDCIALNAGALAYNAHSNSNEGMTRVYGGRAENCDLFVKNSFGAQIYEGVNFVKNNSTPGSTWLFQAGAGDTTANKEAVCIARDCTFEFDTVESLFLIKGSSVIEGNTIVYRGAASTEPTFFQIQLNNDSSALKINDNVFDGADIKYGFSHLVNDAGGGEVLQTFEFKDNTFKNELELTAFDDVFFDFAGTVFKSVEISGNDFNTKVGSVAGRFLVGSMFTCDVLRIDRNTSSDVKHAVLFSSSTISAMYLRDNFNIAADSRSAGSVNKLFSTGNLPKSASTETTGATSGTATVLVSNFEAGAEYQVEISTDNSNTGTGFLTKAIYTVLVSRDGVGLVAGVLSAAGTEANIGAQFQITGSNIEFWTANATTHYVNVEKKNDR